MAHPEMIEMTMNTQLNGRNVVIYRARRGRDDPDEVGYLGSMEEATEAIRRNFMDPAVKKFWVGSQRGCLQELALVLLALGLRRGCRSETFESSWAVVYTIFLEDVPPPAEAKQSPS